MSDILGSLIKRGLQIRQGIDLKLISPWILQKMVFRRLLDSASKTQFGKHYDFKGILSSDNPIKKFQETVPIHDYNSMYNEWWHRLLDQEQDVCWPGKIEYFALSSGTSGAPSKHIPISDEMLKYMRRASFKVFFSLSKYKFESAFYTREMLAVGSSSDLKDCGGYFAGDLSGINAKMPPLWAKGYYRPGTEISKIADWNERIEVIAQNALDWDIGSIVGVPSWVQLTLEKIIEYHNLDSISDIWPNLEVFVHSGIAIGPYKSSFDKLIKNPINYVDSYLASEGFIAFQNRPNADGMVLLARNGIFFEFVPFDEVNFDAEGDLVQNPTAYTINDVIEGNEYAIVLSTCAGAWRYLLGDVVKFVNMDKFELVITGRTKHFLSITGEHLSVDNMNHAIELAQHALGVCIQEYTVTALRSGAFFKHQWYVSCEPVVDATILKETIDSFLCEINEDYKTERSAFLDIELEVVPVQMFFAWLKFEGRSFGQSKMPRVMKADQHNRWNNFICSTKSSNQHV